MAKGVLARTAAAATPNQVVPGTLTLDANFECIGMRCTFTSDDNDNATATMRYKPTGGGTWFDAYAPIVDRRTTIGGVSNAAYDDEARGSIVGLTANTSYDVEVIWSDPDGVNGTATKSGTVSTVALSPPATGTTKYVDGDAAGGGDGSSGSPYNTIATAITNTSAGDTILVRDSASAYVAMTISTSGTASQYRILQNDTGHTPTIAAGASDNLVIDANYWKIKGITFAASVQSAIRITGTSHHIYIDGNTAADVGTANAFGSGAVELGGGAHHIYILNNSFTRTSTGVGVEVDGVWIDSDGCYNIVIQDNTLSGNFWDGIGNGANSAGGPHMDNSDFARNTFLNWQDDMMEMDGGSVNLRVYGNSGSSTLAGSILSASAIQGPAYVFRNHMLNTSSGVGVKHGHNGAGYAHFFHNTLETLGPGSNEVVGEAGGTPYSENSTWLNNILKASGNIYYFQGRSNTYNYNLTYQTTGSDFASNWNSTTAYSTFAAFKTGTSQELQGVNGNPLFLNAAKEIGTSSPAKNVGVVLNNFNDANSAWPYKGSAPDCGYFEFQE